MSPQPFPAGPAFGALETTEKLSDAQIQARARELREALEDQGHEVIPASEDVPAAFFDAGLVFDVPDHPAGMTQTVAVRAVRVLYGSAYRLTGNAHDAEDATLVEVNPLCVTKQGKVLALDAKVNFDDNAMFRRPGIADMHDPSQGDPREAQAAGPQLQWLREGSVNMLTLDLAQWRDVQVADYERTLDVLRALKLDAARFRTAYRLLGTLMIALPLAGLIAAAVGMFFGIPSSRKSGASCWRRHRLRRAMATMRFASFCIAATIDP